ncbi:unnamed protein product [Dovyalis caffra]|uniref:Pentatricopeptide repeat-containing protein n=1 Tax=Dovyalis caffra TaxID=77055 RepID=A0AAV1SIX6_9ROSI|nr:unnamed protein product [Dovyalis caffra]
MGLVDDALWMYQKIVKVMPPLEQACNVLLHGLIKKGRFDSMWELYRGIVSCKEKGIGPNDVIYNALIRGFCSESKLSEAEALFQQMRESGFLPDLVSSMESKSSHPMAAALVDFGRTRSIEPKPENVKEFQNFPREVPLEGEAGLFPEALVAALDVDVHVDVGTFPSLAPWPSLAE